MSKIEQVAAALAFDRRNPVFDALSADEYWQRLKDEGGDAEYFMGQARVAIKAMRVPTDHMIEFVNQHERQTLGVPTGPRLHYSAAWDVMIDAALEEE